MHLTTTKETSEKSSKKSTTDQMIIDELKKLPKDFWDFKNTDTQELTHGLHSYPAMMIYPISRNILKIMKAVTPINTLLDPFAGSGTVLVEGVLSGIKQIYGNDLNPLSQLLCSVKTTPLCSEKLKMNCTALVHNINNQYAKYSKYIMTINDYFSNHLGLDLTEKKGWGDKAYTYLADYFSDNAIDLKVPNFKNIGYWFKPSAIMELQIIKDEIKKIDDTDIQKFVFVAFSETIRLVSNRRNGEFKMFRMESTKVTLFHPDVKKEFFKILERNISKIQIYSDICDRFDKPSNVIIRSENSMHLKEIPDESVDLVITSPPYGDSKTTVAYGEYSRLSLQWLGLDNLTDENILGIDRALMGGTKYRNGFQYTLKSQTLKNALERIKNGSIERAGDVFSFYHDLDLVIKEVALKTRKNGYQFWVVGNRTVKGENLKTDVIITELAKQYGMKHVYTIDRNISNKVMPSKNSPTNKSGLTSDTMVNEHIVILRKKNNDENKQ